MEGTYFTISYSDVNGNSKFVPLFDKLGNRLEMHQSDRIYFGTLKYRRYAELKSCNFEKYRNLIIALTRVDNEKKFGGSGNSVMYLYTQYYKPTVSSDELISSGYASFTAEVICNASFEIKG